MVFLVDCSELFQFSAAKVLRNARVYARSLNRLTSEVIEADVRVINTQRVEQIEDGLGHHRRTAEVVLDILGSVMLLYPLGVARISRARSRSLPRAAGAHSPHPAWHTPRTPPAPMR